MYCTVNNIKNNFTTVKYKAIQSTNIDILELLLLVSAAQESLNLKT